MSNKTAFKCLNLGRHILLMRSKSHTLACIPRMNSIKSYRVTCYDSQTCRGRNLLILRRSIYTTLYYIVGMWYVTARARRFATTVLHLCTVYPVRREKNKSISPDGHHETSLCTIWLLSTLYIYICISRPLKLHVITTNV